MSRYRQTMREALKKVYESDAYDNNRYLMKKYMGQILARPDNSNTKDGKDHVYAPNAQIAKQLYKQGKKVYREEVELNEDKFTDYMINKFHGAYTKNVRRPEAYSGDLGIILDKIKKFQF